MISSIVRCMGVEKIYGNGLNQVVALSHIDMTIEEGELFMLVGPSGCGKTTLISIVAGILMPTRGTCDILSTPLNTLSQRELLAFRAKNIGFVFQSYNLLPSLNLEMNVSVPLLIQGVPEKEALEVARHLLDRVGLEGRYKARPIELSGGQQQRVAIARALVHRPRLIVCDEPTSALDEKTGHQVMDLMKEMIKDHNSTLIVVTHDSRIFSYATRFAKMSDGRIADISSPEKSEKKD